MKTIYLHIGQTKTATTSLQAFFHKNQKWLLEHDIYYPECPEDQPIKMQHRFLAESFSRVVLPIPEEMAAWTYIKNKISAVPQSNILISEEVFWHVFEQRRAEKPSVLEWIKKQFDGYEVKIVCYLRRQDKWIESWYNQLVKTNVDILSNLGYVEFIDVYRNYGLLDYHEALAPWAAIFGKENLIVRPFEKKAFLNEDIIADFMSILGVDLDEAVIRPTDLQVSLCNSACELTWIYNKTKGAREFKPKFMSIVNAYDAEVDDRRRFTNRALAYSIINEFKESNALLSSEYGRDGEGFFDSKLSGYEFGEYQGLSVQELTAFTVHLFQDMQGQIRRLRKRVADLESIISGEKK